ncbi:MAG: ATP-binding cassette domain-containing protein [Phycisphaerae bacterium]
MSKKPPAASAPAVRVRKLKKTYQLGEVELRVLRGVNFEVKSGQFASIIGASGSGKSTLLHLIGQLDRADDGVVELFGKQPSDRSVPWLVSIASAVLFSVVAGGVPFLLMTEWLREINTMSLVLSAALSLIAFAVGIPVIHSILKNQAQRQRDRLRNRDIGFVFQQYHLLPELNVLENVIIASRIKPGIADWFRRRGAVRARAAKILEDVGLGDRLKHKPKELSGGERQRVAIARALLNEPRILLADEPTGNLDSKTGRHIMDLLLECNRSGQTILMVTHDASLAEMTDRVLHLRDGKLNER